MGRIKKFLGALGLDLLLQFWPYIAAVGGILAGWLEGVPWFHVYVGALVCFAAAASSVMRISEWKERNQIEYMLVFQHMRVGIDIQQNVRTSVLVGFQYENLTTLPLECKVESLSTKIADGGGKEYYPPDKPYEHDQFLIRPKRTWFFDNHAVSVDTTVKEFNIEVRGTLLYGRKGQLKYREQIAKRATAVIDRWGRASTGTWYDLP